MGLLNKKGVSIFLFLLFGLCFLAAEENVPSEGKKSDLYQYDTSEKGKDYWFFGKQHIPGPEEKRFINDIGDILVPGILRRMRTLNEEAETISEISLNVPYEWRKAAYEKNRIDLAGDFDFLGSFGSFSMFTLGFGIPNFFQSDFLWGGIWLGTEILGYVTMGLGMAAISGSLNNVSEAIVSPVAGFFLLWGGPAMVLGGFVLDALIPISILWLKSWGSLGVHAIQFVVGSFLFNPSFLPVSIPAMALAWGARIGSLVSAIVRSVRYNTTLKKALLIQSKQEVSLSPVIDPIGKNYGAAVSLKL